MNTHTHDTQPLDEEARAHQERTSSIRFKLSMVQGIGGATVFGLAGGLFQVLFAIASGAKTFALGAGTLAASTTTGAVGGAVAPVAAAGFTATMAWASAGIALAVIVGLGCIYLGSRYSSELMNLEQSRHAKQIAKGINGVGQGVEQKPVPYPSQGKVTEALDTPTEKPNPTAPAPAPKVQAVQLQEKVVPISALSEVRSA